MQKNLIRKGIAFIVILLFIGMGVIPSTSTIVEKKSNILTFNDGSLSGYVNDTSMNPIEGARVQVCFHGTYEENFSDSSGYYHVTNIPICNCTKNCTAFMEGYKPERVWLSIYKNTTYDFVLTHGNTLYVGGAGEGNYTKIQDAIDNSSDGDTVFVYNGTYDLDTRININKSINLIGENKYNTIINGSGINVAVSYVHIYSFTIQNGFGISTDLLISDDTLNNLTVSDNIFKSNENSIGLGGIEIFNTSNSTISDNTFFNCGLWIFSWTSEFAKWISFHNLVYNNTVNGKPLVYLENISNKDIDNAGQVILIDCDNITVDNLELYNTIIGVQLLNSTNCLISDNKISNNFIGAISFIKSNNNTISGNVISDEDAVVFFDSKCNTISGNDFKTKGFYLIFDKSPKNYISENNFRYSFVFWILKGVFSIDSDNTWIGNYWNRPRLLPVLILRYKITPHYQLKYCFDFDWHPAKEPYDRRV